MTTTDTTLLIILTVLLSIFILILIAAAVMAVQLLAAFKRVAAKAEDVIESAEEAVEVIKDAHGPMAVFKLVRNIIKVVNKANRSRK